MGSGSVPENRGNVSVTAVPKCVAIFEKNFRIPSERFVEAMTQTDICPCLPESVVSEALRAGKAIAGEIAGKKKP